MSIIADELGVHARKALSLIPDEATCTVVVWSDELTADDWTALKARFGARVIPKISKSPQPGIGTTQTGGT